MFVSSFCRKIFLMKSSVICVILFFTRVCLLSVLGPSTLLKHISAYSCTVFSYIFSLRAISTLFLESFCTFSDILLLTTGSLCDRLLSAEASFILSIAFCVVTVVEVSAFFYIKFFGCYVRRII